MKGISAVQHEVLETSRAIRDHPGISRFLSFATEMQKGCEGVMREREASRKERVERGAEEGRENPP